MDNHAVWNAASITVRPLAVISIVAQVAKDPGYHLARLDIESWEKRNGKIPGGSVVMVRSDCRSAGATRRWQANPFSLASRWQRCNFFTRNLTFYFTATSRSTPTPLPTSMEKPG